MITGERPFQADDTLTLLGMHRGAPVPLIKSRLPPDTELPEGLQDVIDRGDGQVARRALPVGDRVRRGDRRADRPPRRPTGPRGFPVVGQQSSRPSAPRRCSRATRAARWRRWSRPRGRRARRDSSERTVADPPEVEPGIARSAPPDACPSRPARSAQPAGAASRSSSRSSSSSRLGILLALVVLGGGAYAAYYVQGRAKGQTAGREGAASSRRASRRCPIAVAARASWQRQRCGAGRGGQRLRPLRRTGPDRAAAPRPALPRPRWAAAARPRRAAARRARARRPRPRPRRCRRRTRPTNPDPAGANRAEDEDDNAPKTPSKAQTRPSRQRATPALATTINGAVKLIQDGKRDLALASLLALEQKAPKSAYTAFLLGNLYFDQRWWSVAMEYYRAAIIATAATRPTPSSSRNVIGMLVSKKTDGQAGPSSRSPSAGPAILHLQAVTRPIRTYIRKYAAALARQIRKIAPENRPGAWNICECPERQLAIRPTAATGHRWHRWAIDRIRPRPLIRGR